MNSQDVFEGLDALMDSFIGGESSYQEISYFINESISGRDIDILDLLHEYIEDLIKCFDLKYDWLALNSFYSFHRKLVWTIRNVDSKNYKETLRSVSKKVSPKLKAELNQCIGK